MDPVELACILVGFDRADVREARYELALGPMVFVLDVQTIGPWRPRYVFTVEEMRRMGFDDVVHECWWKVLRFPPVELKPIGWSETQMEEQFA
jgi:hypothetical protein